MTKRSFFKSLMGAVAAVALAPEITFGQRLAIPNVQAWEVYMLWRNGAEHKAVLCHPCSEMEKNRFLQFTMEMVNEAEPDWATFQAMPGGPLVELRYRTL